MNTMTGRQFNHAVSEARRLANNEPVFVTDRGRPAHVLMSYEHYQKLKGSDRKIADLLAMDGDADLELPYFNENARSAELS